nr:peptide-methionine (R)-S-oxide reductase [Mycolicibacterium sarraceniae]
MAHEHHPNPAAVSALPPEQYRVTQENGTERPFTGQYWDNHEPGVYVDVVIHLDDLEARGYGDYTGLFETSKEDV